MTNIRSHAYALAFALLSLLAPAADAVVLTTPQLSAPASGSFTAATSATLSWLRVTDATSYVITLSDSPDIVSGSITTRTTASLTLALTGLLSDVTYYWRVQARNDTSGTVILSPLSEIRAFATLSAPDAAVLTAPASGATGLTTPIVLTWEPAARASSYAVTLYAAANPGVPLLTASVGTALTYTITTSLSPLTYYFWKITATNSSGQSNATEYFTTDDVHPEIPTLIAPIPETRDAPLNVTLLWQVNANTLSCHVQVATDSAFTSVTDELSDIPNSQTQLAMTALENGTTYWWRIQAANNTYTSEWTASRSFTTIVAAPEAPNLLAPTDAAGGITNPVTFNWEATPRATRYTFALFAASDTTAPLLVADSLTEPSYTLDSLLVPATTYLWRITASNAGGTASASQTFTTAGIIPEAPSLAAPANGQVDLRVDPLLQWLVPSNATSCRLQVASDSDFIALILDQEGLPLEQDSLQLSGLDSGATYWWRLQATSATTDTSAWSETWSFSTVAVVEIAGGSRFVRPLQSFGFEGVTEVRILGLDGTQLLATNLPGTGATLTESAQQLMLQAGLPAGRYLLEIETRAASGGWIHSSELLVNTP
jgi:hypothetical protein